MDISRAVFFEDFAPNYLPRYHLTHPPGYNLIVREALVSNTPEIVGPKYDNSIDFAVRLANQ